MNPLIIILMLMIITGILGLFHERVPKPFRNRKCMGAAWKRTFPDAEANEIRKFLKVLTWSFDFKTNDGLKFSPTDTFMDIYSGIYQHSWQADELEHLEFILTLEEEFGREYPEELSEGNPTLGDIFNAMRQGANHSLNRTSQARSG